MRKFFKQLHKWLSIPVGLIIVIVCLTGAILVFQQEILEITNPSHYFVKEVKSSPIALDEVIPAINAQSDSSVVISVEIQNNAERTYRLGLSDNPRASTFVDPYTGQITGKYEFRKSSFYTIMSLHRWLMDGSRTWGKYTVGIATIIFIVILISGLFLWMPKKLNRNSFTIKTSKGRKRLLYDLHNVLGAYACLILLVCALTGLMWSFEWYRNTVFGIFGAETKAEEPRNNDKQSQHKNINYTNWQKVVDTVTAGNPNYKFISIQEGVLSIQLNSFGASRAMDKYHFDSDTGEITQIIPFKDQETKSKIWAWVYSLHVGNYWGIWSKIFTCIVSLIGASLPLTGYYLYFAKRKRKKKYFLG